MSYLTCSFQRNQRFCQCIIAYWARLLLCTDVFACSLRLSTRRNWDLLQRTDHDGWCLSWQIKLDTWTVKSEHLLFLYWINSSLRPGHYMLVNAERNVLPVGWRAGKLWNRFHFFISWLFANYAATCFFPSYHTNFRSPVGWKLFHTRSQDPLSRSWYRPT